MMKLTKKIALEAAMNAVENSTLPNWTFTAGDETLEISKTELLEKLRAMLTDLEKRAAAPKKPTAKQAENAFAAEELLRVLNGMDKPMTITELMEFGAFADGVSNQKASAIMKVLIDAGKVERVVDKRKAYFKVVAEG
jgi:hypothetical protein